MKPTSQIKVTYLKAKDVSVVWQPAQRPFDERHADYLAENFDPQLFDPLSVTKADEHGKHHVVRGQHRLAAFKKVFGDEQMVPCIVADVNDKVAAAELFLKDADAHKALKAVEEFMVAVTAARPDEVAINRIVEKVGYKIGTTHQPHVICAVKALKDVYSKHSGNVLGRTLITLHSTWGADNDAMKAPMIRGYGEFIALYGSRVDAEILHSCMTRRRMTPGRVLNEARHEASMRKNDVKNLTGGMVVAVFQIYNSCAGRKKLNFVAGAEKKTAEKTPNLRSFAS